MVVINFLMKTLCVLVLLTCILIALVGSLWVLRVVVDWWLDVDYVKAIKELLLKNKSIDEIAVDLKKRRKNKS